MKDRSNICNKDFATIFFQQENEPHGFLCDFYDYHLNYIFPEKFIESYQVVQKIWRFSSAVLATFSNYSVFWHFFFTKHFLVLFEIWTGVQTELPTTTTTTKSQLFKELANILLISEKFVWAIFRILSKLRRFKQCIMNT